MNYQTNYPEYTDLFRNIPHQFRVISTQPELIIVEQKKINI